MNGGGSGERRTTQVRLMVLSVSMKSSGPPKISVTGSVGRRRSRGTQTIDAVLDETGRVSALYGSFFPGYDVLEKNLGLISGIDKYSQVHIFSIPEINPRKHFFFKECQLSGMMQTDASMVN